MANDAQGLGLNCTSAGVSLAGVPLLHTTTAGLAPRPDHEISALLKAAYGRDSDPGDISPGLAVAAQALNQGELGRAMIAAVRMKLPELSSEGAARIASAEEELAKFDPSEPRDRRGRWTTGGEADATTPAPSSRRRARNRGNSTGPLEVPPADHPDQGPDRTPGRNSELTSNPGGDRPPTNENAPDSPVSPRTRTGDAPIQPVPAVASRDVDVATLIPAAYNGHYHDQVVAEFAAFLQSKGEIVLTEVRFAMADGSAAARLDILAWDPQTNTIYGVEVKTGDRPGFTPGQLAVYPHLMWGGSVISPDGRVVGMGLPLNTPLQPIPIFLILKTNVHSERQAMELDQNKMSRYYRGH